MHKRDKETAKKALFLAALFPIEIRTLSRIISLKCAEFIELWGMWVLGIVNRYEELRGLDYVY